MNGQELRNELASHGQWLDGIGGARADLSRANLRWADLRGADFSRADLRWADLRGADFSRADLRGANLRWANLRGANLRWADLRGADFSRADLRWADLRWADFSRADLRGANLRWANLRGADLVHAICGQYAVYATSTHTSCGCKRLENAQWKSATAESVAEFAGDASDWWRLWGDMVLRMIEKAEEIAANREAEEVAATS